MRTGNTTNTFSLESLEPRIMLSGDGATVDPHAAPSSGASIAGGTTIVTAAFQTQRDQLAAEASATAVYDPSRQIPDLFAGLTVVAEPPGQGLNPVIPPTNMDSVPVSQESDKATRVQSEYPPNSLKASDSLRESPSVTASSCPTLSRWRSLPNSSLESTAVTDNQSILTAQLVETLRTANAPPAGLSAKPIYLIRSDRAINPSSSELPTQGVGASSARGGVVVTMDGISQDAPGADGVHAKDASSDSTLNTINDLKRWVQVRAFLGMNDQSITPALKDISVNYRVASATVREG